MRRMSRIEWLKLRYRRNHKGPKPLYLYVFPEERERGWLCDGNDDWGKEINRWKKHLRTAESVYVATKDKPATSTYRRKT